MIRPKVTGADSGWGVGDAAGMIASCVDVSMGEIVSVISGGVVGVAPVPQDAARTSIVIAAILKPSIFFVLRG